MQTIAITQGDPAGIGPEIVAKAFRDAPDDLRGCFAVGDLATLRRAAQCIVRPGVLELPVAQIVSPDDAWHVPPRCMPVLQLPGLPGPVPWGRVSAAAGRAAADCVVWAARAALQGHIAALVTAPLHKEALSAAGVAFPGHTELLQAEAATHQGVPLAAMPVRMMLANAELKTVLNSIHVSLREAIEAVTVENVMQTIQVAQAFLEKQENIRAAGRKPIIAVAGLNPHAGEAGRFGREEIDTIGPAIEAARQQGMDVRGPFPPDTVFMTARAQAHKNPPFCDVVIAMYHDQGLIPVKYLGVQHGVNVTLGLPLLRTSPDHGTAFDLAGSGRADSSSMLEAVRLALHMTSFSQAS